MELNDKSGVYEFRDCTEFPTLIGDDWNYNLILKVQFDGGKDDSLDSNKDVDTGNVGGGSTTTVTTPETDKSFADVDENAYYKAAVDWAVEKGITSGTTATTFTPDATVTRAQVVTFQNRMAGSPKAEGANPFSDVADNAYYHDAVLWAAKNGITSGMTAATFAPNAGCTRGQIVTFLWRAAGSPAPKGTAKVPGDVLPGSYCYNAVAWAIENGITNGMADGTFGVNDTCTRGQSVTFLHRALGTAPSAVNGFTDVAADSFCADAVAWAVENGVTNGTSATTFSPNNGCTRAQIVTFLYCCLK